MSSTTRRAALPKWARDEIERLEHDLADAHKRLSAGPEDSNTFANPYGSTSRPLGEDTLIEFRLSEEDRIRVRIEDSHLDINGSAPLSVWPRASNDIRVEVR